MLLYSLTTLGCKVNQYDSAALAAALEAAGLRAVGARSRAGADLAVINTCCVTVTAMRKSRQAVARAVRGSPGAAVLVVGCYGDYDALRLGKLLRSLGVPPHRAVVAGHHDGDLPDRVRRLVGGLGQAGEQPLARARRRDPQASPRYDECTKAGGTACPYVPLSGSTDIW